MTSIGSAYLRARQKVEGLPERGQERDASDSFKIGVDWVQNLLVPGIIKANDELEDHHIRFRLDVNLDRRSTNHAHADFWISSDSTHATVGPKYSINVIGGREVWLYKAGAEGRLLGTVEHCGAPEIETLLAAAAEEFGGLQARH